MTTMDTHEGKVRRFYDSGPGGEDVTDAYRRLMGETWFHGDWTAQKAGESPQAATDAMVRRFADHGKLRQGCAVLEFGSGVGGAAVQLAETTGATVVGLSNTDSLNQYARRLAADRGMSRQVSFVTVGDEDYRTLTAWPAGTFDAVISMEAICHLTDRQAFFDTAYRLTKPGGRLVVLDWLQRPYRDHQTAKQIEAFIDPVCELFRLARPLGTVDGYAAMMQNSGFRVTHAADEFAGDLCLGNTDALDKWTPYEGRSSELVMTGKQALDAARLAGVFTVGWWAAVRP